MDVKQRHNNYKAITIEAASIKSEPNRETASLFRRLAPTRISNQNSPILQIR